MPDDLSLDRELSLEALADAMALLSGVVLRVVPFVPRSLGTNLYGILFVIQQVDSLRKPLDDRFGRERANFLLQHRAGLGPGCGAAAAQLADRPGREAGQPARAA